MERPDGSNLEGKREDGAPDGIPVATDGKDNSPDGISGGKKSTANYNGRLSLNKTKVCDALRKEDTLEKILVD